MPKDQTVTGNQLSAGRMLIEISQKELAERANVSVPTIKRMEAYRHESLSNSNNVAAVVSALEAAGVIFIAAGDVAEGPGVTLCT